METIEKTLQNVVASVSERFMDNDDYKNLEKASEEFKSLVRKGLAQERGYNLEDVEKSHINNIGFNTSI